MPEQTTTATSRVHWWRSPAPAGTDAVEIGFDEARTFLALRSSGGGGVVLVERNSPAWTNFWTIVLWRDPPADVVLVTSPGDRPSDGFVVTAEAWTAFASRAREDSWDEFVRVDSVA